MPDSSSSDGGKTWVRSEHKSDSRSRTVDTASQHPTSEAAGQVNDSWADLLRGDFSQAAFERHAALLEDSRMSQPMYARQKAMIVRQIQRDYGNRYVQRLVEHISRKRAEAVQTKLTVGPAGDRYEQEADRVAKQVVSMTEPVAQRQGELEEEEMVQAMPDMPVQRQGELEKEELQMKPLQAQVGAEGGNVDPDVEQAIEGAQGQGKTLPDDVRTHMESAFGADFSGVKVHTGSQSDNLNQSISARAFTTGQDIFFKTGEYNPGSPAGKEVLAHELTHVVQQGKGMDSGDESAAVQRNGQEQRSRRPSVEALEGSQLVTGSPFRPQALPPEERERAEKRLGGLRLGGDSSEQEKSLSEAHNEATTKESEDEPGLVDTGLELLEDLSVLPSSAEFFTGANLGELEDLAEKWGITGVEQQPGEKDDSYKERLRADLKAKLDEIGMTPEALGFESSKGFEDFITGWSLGLSGASALFSGVQVIMKIRNDFSKDNAWYENVEKGFEVIVTGLSGVESGLETAATIEQLRSEGAGETDPSDLAKGLEKGINWMGPIAGLVEGIGHAFNSVISLWKAIKKGKSGDYLSPVSEFAQFLESAFKTALKWRKATKVVPSKGLLNAVPGAGIAVAAVSMLIDGYKAYKAAQMKNKMIEESENEGIKLSQIAMQLGAGDIVQVEKRGVFGFRKAYIRVLPSWYEAISLAAQQPELSYGVFEDRLTQQGVDEPKAKVLTDIYKNKGSEGLKKLSQAAMSYQFVSKMSEINQKRQIKGWGRFFDGLLKMSADIASLIPGGGTAASGGIKLVQGAAKAGRGIGLAIQKVFRRGGSRSQTAKKQEYAQHSRFVMQSLAALPWPPRNEGELKQYERMKLLLESTGVDLFDFEAETDAGKRFTMLVEAMGKRD